MVWYNKWMAEKKRQGSIGEIMIMAEAVRRGYKVAIPWGEDSRYDLIVDRIGKLEKVQCKYTRSNGELITARCRSSNNWNQVKYSCEDIDWLAIYDLTSQKCYFIPSVMLGEGRNQINLRIKATGNNQVKGVLWAKDFEVW